MVRMQYQPMHAADATAGDFVSHPVCTVPLMPLRPDDPRRELAVQMRLEGMSRSQIAEALGFKSGGGCLNTWLKDVPPPEWTKRPNAKDDLREIAIAMRKEGKSYREIAEVVPVSKGTLSLWLRDIELTDEQLTLLRERRACSTTSAWQGIRTRHELRRAKVVAEARAQIPESIAESELFVAGVVAYWAEGSKHKQWRSQNQVTFINSDPEMILLFMRWLRLLGYSTDDCLFRLSIHETADLAAATTFWAELLEAPLAYFRKPVIKCHNPKTVRRNVGDDYRGCLVVRVRRSTDLYRQILGWWQGIVAGADL